MCGGVVLIAAILSCLYRDGGRWNQNGRHWNRAGAGAVMQVKGGFKDLGLCFLIDTHLGVVDYCRCTSHSTASSSYQASWIFLATPGHQLHSTLEELFLKWGILCALFAIIPWLNMDGHCRILPVIQRTTS